MKQPHRIEHPSLVPGLSTLDLSPLGIHGNAHESERDKVSLDLQLSFDSLCAVPSKPFAWDRGQEHFATTWPSQKLSGRQLTGMRQVKTLPLDLRRGIPVKKGRA